MTLVYYISHPDVVVDPDVPVPEWDLSEVGLRRLDALLTQPWLANIQAVFCSSEQKAKTAAKRIAAHLALPFRIIPELGEIDRSATGYLPPAELEPVVAALCANPDESVRSWERANDAQARNVAAVRRILQFADLPDVIAVVGHGGVGTLLMNHVKRTPITRADGPPGQGYYYLFEAARKGDQIEWHLLHGWKPIDLKE